jgi:hypothetical protein
MEIKKGKFIDFIISGRCNNKEEYKHYKEIGNNPKFGFNWWYWKPKYQNFYKNDKYMNGFKIMWLCFLVDYTDYNDIY